ncbi:MAG: hypothetical protein HYY24_02205 [Verrucomicrobia bacterium]|nr:hypothetical protein [Verrucomicrobiota bacterium]
MKTKFTIPKSVECDKTIEAVLKDVIQRNQDCIVLESFEITKTTVELIYEDEHCQESPNQP